MLLLMVGMLYRPQVIHLNMVRDPHPPAPDYPVHTVPPADPAYTSDTGEAW
ncbi:hypothetical protein [Actinomadura atramentaria]|uniref:hypothetical protein n=1 Tax=Actinomadura atramentaria TaxID=1990 RepID=UPI0003AA85D9|nr:hypothetical protein [Actinomadura atramentaria]